MDDEVIVLSNAGLEALPGETYTEFATRAAREHERRGCLDDAQKWRDARWDHMERDTDG